MERAALLRWLGNRFLRRHLHGHGIEIGALWRRFPVPPGARVWYADRLSAGALAEHYPELKGRILPSDLVADAAQLPVASASLDFLIASHLLEHLPFPLAALRAWHDTLRPGGVLLLKIPDKRYTFDAPRERTSLAHLLQEYEHPERFEARAHYADWVEHVGGRSRESPEFEREVGDLMRRDYSIHFHVWTDADVREIVDFTRTAWKLDWNPVLFWPAHFYRKETTVLLRRA
jgi:predicted SAM-dependent methyltransferase